MLSSTPAKEEVTGVIDRTKFAESLKEILMSCDDVRANTDWFNAVLYAYGVVSDWYLPGNIPFGPNIRGPVINPNIGEFGITWKGPSDGSCDPDFWVDVDTGTRPVSITTKSTDKFDPDVTTTSTTTTRGNNNGF